MANEYSVLIKELNDLIAVDKSIRIAVSSVLAMQKKRIFSDGKAANGSKIGTYSTKTTSISKKAQAKNTGKTYFKGGYAEYKRLIGRNPGFVILRNTDQMMMGYSMIVLGQGEFGLGFANDFDFNKTQWQEEKWNKDIFDESNEEGILFEKVLDFELDRLLK